MPPGTLQSLAAAKDLADHAVLLPDGFRFSPGKTRRDWTDEGTAALRRFYAEHATGDGTLPVRPYLLATVRHRPALAAGRFDPARLADLEAGPPFLPDLPWRLLAGA